MELAEGTFVIENLGDDVRLGCQGLPQEQATTLVRGVYRASLGEGCVLSGGRWALHGLVRRYLMATAQIKGITIPPLDIAAMIQQDMTQNNIGPPEL